MIGERRFLGLYTSTAYHASPLEIPILRRKVERGAQARRLPPDSHNDKALVEILETHPRDELFQMDSDELFEIAMGILHLGERQRVRLFVRRDPFGRFVACLVFVPRDRFNTENRRRIERSWCERSAAAISTTRRAVGVGARAPALHDPHARRHARRTTTSPRSSAGWSRPPAPGPTTWAPRSSPSTARTAARSCAAATATRSRPPTEPNGAARSAVSDIDRRRGAGGGQTARSLSVYRPLATRSDAARKLFRSAPLSLSDMLPMFENMGVKVVDERPYEVTPSGATRLDLRLRPALRRARRRRARARAVPDGVPPRVAGRARERRAQPPGAGRGAHRARDHDAARDRRATCARPATRSRTPTWSSTLVRAPRHRARCSSSCSRARFDPDAGRRRRDAERLTAEIEEAIDAVASLDEDRILRSFLDVVLRDAAHQLLPGRRGRRARGRFCRSSSIPSRSRACRCRARSSRSSCTRRGSRACTCAAARSPAVGCAGPTGARTSAPRCSG